MRASRSGMASAADLLLGGANKGPMREGRGGDRTTIRGEKAV